MFYRQRHVDPGDARRSGVQQGASHGTPDIGQTILGESPTTGRDRRHEPYPRHDPVTTKATSST